MYTLAMTINHHYWEHNCKHHCARQAEKETFKSHSWKQGKASTSSHAIVFQNKANPSLTASSTKTSSKPSLSPAPKKQPNFSQVILSSKLASNGKLTTDEYKKYLENNLCLYYGIENHKLDSCPKKQTMVTSKGHSASATADLLVAASEKSLEK